MTNRITNRVHYIDALRGAAIMLSLEQHIGVWLFRADGTTGQLERSIFYWINAFIRTYIMVTHLGYGQSEAVAEKYRTCNVKFDLIDFDCHIKNISVEKE